MNELNPDKRFDALVHRAMVPKGYRPRTNEQIEQMLGTIGGVPVDQDKLARMLAKLNSQLPPSPGPKGALPYPAGADTDGKRAMRALHKAPGPSISAQMRAKIEEIERKAASPAEDDGAADG